MRRTFCFLLALVLCVGALSMSVLAASGEATAATLDGTGETTYTVIALGQGPEGCDDFGTVSVKAESGEACSQFKAGDAVYIEATPASGYKVTSIMTQMESGQPFVEVGNRFTLTDSMPSSEVCVWVFFEVDNTAKLTFHVRDTDGTSHTYWKTAETGKDYALPTTDSNSKNNIVTGYTIGNTTYAPGDTVQFTADTDIYAVYSEEPGIALSFVIDGGPADGYVIVYLPKGGSYTMDTLGYDAVTGWSGSNNALTHELGKTYTFNQDTTLLALFADSGTNDEDDNDYMIYMDINCPAIELESGGPISLGCNPQIMTQTEMLVALKELLEEEEPFRPGYALLGWALDAAGTQLWDGTTLPAEGSTLYAIWARDTVFTDKDTGVSVVVLGSEKIDAELKLVVSLPDESAETNVGTILVAKVDGEVEKAYVLDIHFIDEDGDRVSVDAIRTVTIPIPEGWDAGNTAVYYVDAESGSATNMNGVVSDDGKSITFTTNHFSFYALVQTAVAPAVATASASPTLNGNSPKTGDDSRFVLWAIVLLAACGGGTALVIRSRKKEN